MKPWVTLTILYIVCAASIVGIWVFSKLITGGF